MSKKDEDKKKKKKRNKGNMMGKIASIFLVILMLLSMFAPIMTFGMYKWEGSYLTYGAGLSESQLQELKDIFKVDDDINGVKITGDDYLKYAGFKANDSSLYSSALIVKGNKGSGVNIIISTPNNITEIKDHQYMNAAITSGITDSDIFIGSPVQVTGESALVGIYKALELAGVEVNQEAAQVSNEELSLINSLDNNNKDSDFTSEDLSLALAEIKEVLASMEDRSSLTPEQVEKIVDEALSNHLIKLSDSDREKLLNWVNKFKSLDVDWDSLKTQLKDFGKDLSSKLGDLYETGKESGFFDKVKNFFAKTFNAIKDFFVVLFSD